MVLNKYTGSTQMDGLEDSLFKIVGTTMKHFASYVYLKALQAGEQIRLRVYNKVDDVSHYKFDGDVLDSVASNNGTITYNANLKALLKFEQNVNDSTTGANNGTVTGTTTYVSGVEGSGFSFDGASIITLANESNFDFERTQAFSISFWINSTTTGVTQVFVDKFGAGTSGYFVFISGAGNTLGFNLINTNASNAIKTSTSPTILDGKWHHIVVTYDGSSTGAGVKHYVDSVSQSVTISQDNLSATILNNTAVTLGERAASSFPYTGQMDEMRIYNIALSQAQVSALYMVGKYGQSHTFDGGEYISFGSTSTWTFLHSNAGSTVAFWSKLPVGSYSSTPLLMGTHNSSGGTIGFVVEIDSNGKIYYLIGNGSGTLYLNCTTNNSAYTNDGSWHHLAFVFNGTNGVIYLDGVALTLLVNTLTGSASTANSTDVLIMGTSPALSGNNLTGQLDDVRLINRALSSAEVSDLYTYPDSAMKQLIYDRTYSGVKSDAVYIPMLQGNQYMVTAQQTSGTNRIITWEREEIQ